MHIHIAAALAMADLDPEPEQIAQLTLQRFQIGIYGSARGPSLRAPNIVTWPRANLLGQMLRLANRQVPIDDFIGQRFGIRRRQDCPGVAHADIASQEH